MELVHDGNGADRRILQFRSGDHPRCKPKCRHQRFLIDKRHGSVECADCGELVSAFHALLAVAGEETDYHSKLSSMRAEMREIASYAPRLRAVKALEKIWRGKMLPMCPHCKRGITAEALERTGCIHPDYEDKL
jgi:hypothetical protein